MEAFGGCPPPSLKGCQKRKKERKGKEREREKRGKERDKERLIKKRDKKAVTLKVNMTRRAPLKHKWGL